ncbi:MAG: hypothetical protein IT440_04140, partial [Phycisphaeraceae bacterium]|nr:hypothetical protein [Phycisphaeraceae bacterium]
MNRIRIQHAILPVVVLAMTRAALAADAAHDEARTDVIGPYWAGMVPAILT